MYISRYRHMNVCDVTLASKEEILHPVRSGLPLTFFCRLEPGNPNLGSRTSSGRR